MNIQEMDIVKNLVQEPYQSQRVLAEQAGYSLGAVNRCIKSLQEQGLLDEDKALTEQADRLLEENAPRRAVILAAGFGMRMIPINVETPKALIRVKGEVLIERLIRQLHEVGIHEIYVVVGFMKEHFEYLIDDFGVELVVNAEFAESNNLHSLNLVRDKLSNAYILPCDIWCRTNPFSKQELYPWYMVEDVEDEHSAVRLNRKQQLVMTGRNQNGNQMVGISYITKQFAPVLRQRLEEMSQDRTCSQSFWEEALYQNGKMVVWAKVAAAQEVVEINTYEQLRELDQGAEQLQNEAITTIAKALNVPTTEIKEITVLKKGMTNRSFLFSCQGQKYIMRVPGEGTDQLIDRREEASVYQVIHDKKICDDIVYINPENGFKITKYLPNVRVCNPHEEGDLQKVMRVLRNFHQQGITVDHEFDLWGKMEFYETLWEGKPSAYRDYQRTKERVYTLRPFIEAHVGTKTLTHIDAVPDNFLFYQNEKGEEEIRLIDWEYASMQDPHVDIAMFCIYALYNKEEVDHLIDIYFEHQCSMENRVKIYCYVAICGLLWSNWCEYKRELGVDFGEYSLRQYRYAKEYYRYAVEGMRTLGLEDNHHE